LGTEEFPHYTQTHTRRKLCLVIHLNLDSNYLKWPKAIFKNNSKKNMEFFSNAWDHAKEQGEANMKLWKDLQPESYTIEDIKKKATELYEFVEKK